MSNTCTCGNAKGFDNVFDAVSVSYRRTEKKNFDPKLILGGLDGKVSLNLGRLLRDIYALSNDKAVRDEAEFAFSLMYIAEMWPDCITSVSIGMGHALANGVEYDVRRLVYEIIRQERVREEEKLK